MALVSGIADLVSDVFVVCSPIAVLHHLRAGSVAGFASSVALSLLAYAAVIAARGSLLGCPRAAFEPDSAFYLWSAVEFNLLFCPVALLSAASSLNSFGLMLPAPPEALPGPGTDGG
ncbi:hypothetical protein GGS23DRAFT_578382 [Durotheca rogersii]|uniref:uncharacterized protein n=1 Tax=Durotheca rogersii TaxID=419775 RepID=UPI00221E463E|nr:uncharacterized protein GGS23DRAFT_578382 [Durotheca rogersii]KAI5861020.1 hypothetical protein GGS23DRAFT_578382 [Durotheca rogersii]